MPMNSRRAPQRSCLMFAKRIRVREGICAEGVLVREMGDRVDYSHGIKGVRMT